jgi:hypothetical protein
LRGEIGAYIFLLCEIIAYVRENAYDATYKVRSKQHVKEQYSNLAEVKIPAGVTPDKIRCNIITKKREKCNEKVSKRLTNRGGNVSKRLTRPLCGSPRKNSAVLSG